MYFGSDRAVLGTVHGLKAKDFRELFSNFFQKAIPLNLPHEEFLALPKAERDSIKMVPYIVPCQFTTDPSPRQNAHATTFRLVILDLEDMDAAKGEAIVSAASLLPYNHFLHTTASHTPEQPRFRLVVECQETPVAEYDNALRFIAELINSQDVLCISSHKYVQPAYRPVRFLGDTEPHTLSVKLDSHVLDPIEFMSLPAPVTDDTPGADMQGFDENNLSHLPDPEFTIANAAECLKFVDPSCDHKTWVQIGAALKHQFGYKNRIEAARALFHEWSCGLLGETLCSKYTQRATDATWKSLRPYPKDGTQPVTIATLIHFAQQSGYDPSPVVDDTILKILQKVHNAKSASDAKNLATRGIALSRSLDNSAIEVILQAVRKRFLDEDMRVSVSSLKKDVKEQEDRNKREGTVKPPPWLNGWVYRGDNDSFYNAHDGNALIPAAFNRCFINEPRTGFEDITPSEYALMAVKIPNCIGTTYDLGNHEEMVVTNASGNRIFNVAHGTVPSPNDTLKERAGALWMSAVTANIPDPWERELFVSWCAHTVQNPNEKIRWAIYFFGGVEGTGKTAILQAVGSAVGQRNVQSVNAMAREKGWSEYLANTKLVIYEEMSATSRDIAEFTESVKEVITNSTIQIHQRNRDSKQVANYLSVAFASNYSGGVNVSSADRRYFVIESALDTVEKKDSTFPEDYWTEFHTLNSTLAGGLRAWFMEYQIDRKLFKPEGPAPVTKAKVNMQADTRSEMMVEIEDVVLCKETAMVNETFVSLNDLRMCLLRRNAWHGNRAVSNVLHQMGYTQKIQTNLNKKRTRIYVKSSYDTELDKPFQSIHDDLNQSD